MARPVLSVPRRTVAGTASLLLGLGLLAAMPAQAATDPCPAPAPVASLTVDQPLTGLTVEVGVVPDPFTATYMGRIVDGIAPGVDMLVVDTDSPAIQRAEGVWAGMSGSPVYTLDGALVGAVSYGLSAGPSSIAGVTPAEDMAELLDLGGAAALARRAKTVAVPDRIEDRIVATGEASATEAAAGLSLKQLPMPIRVTGLSDARADEVTKNFARLAGAVVGPSAGSTTAAATAADLVPGGNLAATIAYGDLTAGGVGTVTAVCGGSTVLGFGHPLTWSGAFTGGLHPAEAVYVQPDVTFAPFKVANFGDIVGTVDQDRLVGIRGQVGPLPAETLAASDVRAVDTGRSDAFSTHVTVPQYVPDMAASSLLSNMDTVADRIGGGTTQMTYTIEGESALSGPFSVVRHEHVADQYDVTFPSSYLLYQDLARIAFNEFEDVAITDVTSDAEVDSTYRAYSIVSLSYRTPSGSWQPLDEGDELTAVTGTRLNLRVGLRQFHSASTVTIPVSVSVPSGSQGVFADLTVSGVSVWPDDEEASGAASFGDVLQQISERPTTDSVVARMMTWQEGSGVVRTSGSTETGQMVSGSRWHSVRIVAPATPKAGYVSGDTWRLRPSMSAGPATRTFTLDATPATPLMGDWDGNGTLTPATFNGGRWVVQRNWYTTSRVTFVFGQAGDLPVVGDWDGDGLDSIGVYRQGSWLLRNSAGAGAADVSFAFGGATWKAVAGDWDGDGDDTVGVWRAGAWRWLSDNTGTADVSTASFGRAYDKPVVGDWDRNGSDGLGVYRSGTWYLRNAASTGAASKVFTFGTSTGRPVVG